MSYVKTSPQVFQYNYPGSLKSGFSGVEIDELSTANFKILSGRINWSYRIGLDENLPSDNEAVDITWALDDPEEDLVLSLSAEGTVLKAGMDFFTEDYSYEEADAGDAAFGYGILTAVQKNNGNTNQFGKIIDDRIKYMIKKDSASSPFKDLKTAVRQNALDAIQISYTSPIKGEEITLADLQTKIDASPSSYNQGDRYLIKEYVKDDEKIRGIVEISASKQAVFIYEDDAAADLSSIAAKQYVSALRAEYDTKIQNLKKNIDGDGTEKGIVEKAREALGLIDPVLDRRAEVAEKVKFRASGATMVAFPSNKSEFSQDAGVYNGTYPNFRSVENPVYGNKVTIGYRWPESRSWYGTGHWTMLDVRGERVSDGPLIGNPTHIMGMYHLKDQAIGEQNERRGEYAAYPHGYTNNHVIADGLFAGFLGNQDPGRTWRFVIDMIPGTWSSDDRARNKSYHFDLMFVDYVKGTTDKYSYTYIAKVNRMEFISDNWR
ncbi:hypothetical protein [Vibrio phage BONAISHI]|nr:hypothetical protein [Vibrio phage BONAISHI]